MEGWVGTVQWKKRGVTVGQSDCVAVDIETHVACGEQRKSVARKKNRAQEKKGGRLGKETHISLPSRRL